jgi:chromosome segregation ATPase
MVDRVGVNIADADASRTGSTGRESKTKQGAENSASDPDAVLQELREQAAGAKARADALSAEVKVFASAIEALAANRDDIVNADAAYAKADYPTAIATAKSLAEEKLPCIETSLGERLPEAQQLLEDFTNEVDNVKTDLDAAITSLHAATDTAESANQELGAATASFGTLLSLTKDYDAPVRVLARLQSELKATIDNADAFGAFAIYSEIIRQADDLGGLPALSKYKEQLESRWNEVAGAQQKARDAAETVADRQSEVDRLTVRHVALTTDRVAELRRRWKMQRAQQK